MAKAVAAAVRLDVQMLTVHTCGGSEMLRAAEMSAQETARSLNQSAPLVLGVTVLTSLDSNALSEIGYQANAAHQVERLATLAEKSGLRGLVCSPLEVVGLRQLLSAKMQLVTPGIRGRGDAIGDQRRTLSAPEALAAGSDWLVVGRPIYAAPDPVAAAQSLLASIEEQRKSQVMPALNPFGL